MKTMGKLFWGGREVSSRSSSSTFLLRHFFVHSAERRETARMRRYSTIDGSLRPGVTEYKESEIRYPATRLCVRAAVRARADGADEPASATGGRLRYVASGPLVPRPREVVQISYRENRRDAYERTVLFAVSEYSDAITATST